jgi:outer membrane immunogenic protein
MRNNLSATTLNGVAASVNEERIMRIRTMGAGVIALTVSAGAALAADLPRYQPPPAAPVYTPTSAFNWTGPYVGLTGGYSWGSGNGNGWLGGAYLGYNFQLDPNWVAGIEGDFTFNGKTNTSGPNTFSNPWNSTVRGRIGYAYDRFLFYGTGGVAFGSQKVTGANNAETTKVGWTAGLGAEAALTNNVTARVEWRYTDLGSTTYSNGPVTVGGTSNDLMLGVGVKF